MFDIPLRSPAVMMHGIILLYLVKSKSVDTSIWNPLIDWKRLQPPLTNAKNRIWGVLPED
jgi:hypothetical protein